MISIFFSLLYTKDNNLRYTFENDCPWDENVCTYAAKFYL